MTSFRRFAIYVVPEGDLYRYGADWLGWDSVTGAEALPPDMPGLPAPAADLKERPRKYGFHGTIKPPMRLADSKTPADLQTALAAFCERRAPVNCGRLTVRRLGRFIAIVPDASVPALSDLAARTVEALDDFRMPPSDTELARRRGSGLTARQDELLLTWGYPYVMEEFRFHLTLTGPLVPDQAESIRAVLAEHFAPVLSDPFVIRSLALMGEDAEGRFHLISRASLDG
ncbi:DUF1045 domain-containing protein [Aestuariibius sp. 2305UL40-4]|uniref:DUF1045 domain-containing protein n=1 Tax=Aestuariibius violaceus TaxID=3234132 RepID=UPI00345E4424